MIHMKCQALFSLKKHTHIKMSSAAVVISTLRVTFSSITKANKKRHYVYTRPPCENVSSGMRGQRWPRSDCADEQSDQGPRCPFPELLDTICITGKAQARMRPCAFVG